MFVRFHWRHAIVAEYVAIFRDFRQARQFSDASLYKRHDRTMTPRGFANLRKSAPDSGDFDRTATGVWSFRRQVVVRC